MDGLLFVELDAYQKVKFFEPRIKRQGDRQTIKFEITIPYTQECVERGIFGSLKKFIEYTIIIRTSKKEQFVVKRRYSDFFKLHVDLQNEIVINFIFPSKRWFSNFEPSFIEKRRSDLEHYLRSLLSLEEAIDSCNVYSFLDSSMGCYIPPWN